MSGARGKTDAADAAAICEAVQRANMRFVPLKSEQQQGQLMVHRARQGYVQARTACINRVRGLLAEFGHVLPLKADTVRRQAAALLEDLPGWANTVIGDGYLRSLLILGARAVLARAKANSDGISNWALALQQRRGYWRAVVAIAAKNARMAWAVLRKGENFKMPA